MDFTNERRKYAEIIAEKTKGKKGNDQKGTIMIILQDFEDEIINKMELKVYEFDSGEREYIAAINLNEAKEIYTEITSEDDFSDFKIAEYPKEKWANLIIDYPDDNPKWQETLERKMQRTDEPQYLCATVY